MRRKDLLSRARHLMTEKKVLAVSAFLTIVSCFLPWYGTGDMWKSAFESVGAPGGYVIMLFSLGILALIATELWEKEWLSSLPIKESVLHIFLSAQSFFVALIFIAVYGQYALLDVPNSSSRFGIYLSLFSSLVSSLAALSYHRAVISGRVKEQDFVTMPRTHRAVNEWQEEGEQQEEAVMTEEMPVEQQETMFDPTKIQ